MQKPYTQIAVPCATPAPLANHEADTYERLYAYMRQRRVLRLVEQMREQERLLQAMEAWRAGVYAQRSPEAAAPNLPGVLHQAAAWLGTHPDHPAALTVAMHLERIAPGWRQGGAMSRKASQGGR